MQLRELAHHVSDQIGFGQQRGLVDLRHQRLVAQLPGDGHCDGAHPLHPLALTAQLVVVDHFGQARHARCQGLLAVLVEEKLGISQARAHHALVALNHRSGVVGADVADHQELVCQFTLRIKQREILLVRLHRQDQAFLRHVEKFFLKCTKQDVRTLDQSRYFVQKRFIFNSMNSATNVGCSCT